MPSAAPLNPSSLRANQPATPSVSTGQPIEASRSSAFEGPSNRVDLINSESGRILCIADVRGRISHINELAKENNAVAVIHSGDFGFYEPSSLDRISDRTLRHLIQYSSLISSQFRSQLLAPGMNVQSIRQMILNPPQPLSGSQNPPNIPFGSEFALSEFPDLLSGKLKLDIPVYTVWGACEDVAILEKIRAAGPSVLKLPTQPGTSLQVSRKTGALSPYSIPNLTVLDEATTRCLVIGGVRLRLFGLGGAVVPHKLFDNGEGGATIAGGQGTMWTSVLQVGEVVDTAQRVYDPTETRLFISHASPGREGLLAQLALVLKADLTISAGLHFRYGVSYNEFSVQNEQDAFRAKLQYAKSAFNEIWDTVKGQVEAVIDDHQRQLLSNALAVANRVPAHSSSGGGSATEEPAWKNSWNWNLPDAAFGNLILDIKEGRIGAEMRSQGFNFAYRSAAQSRPPTTETPLSNSRSTSTHPLPTTINPSPNNESSFRPAPANSNSSQTQPQPYNSKPAQESSIKELKAESQGLQNSTEQSSGSYTTSNGNIRNISKAQSHQNAVHGGSVSASRNSNPYSAQSHRYSKSRETKPDDILGDESPQPKSAVITADANRVGNGKTIDPVDSNQKETNKSKVSAATAHVKNSSSQASSAAQKAVENPGRTSPAIPSSSPAPSRKSSFGGRKKRSTTGSAAAASKSDSERGGKERVEHDNGSGFISRNDVSSPELSKDLKDKVEQHTQECEQSVGEKPGKGVVNSAEVPSSGANAGGGSNNYKARGGSRGRGLSGSYGIRNNRGGRGGRGSENGRNGFTSRPAGPGLVGQALAGAGIGNKNNSGSYGNSGDAKS
ncbi:hypothetical protein BY996DRAFT_1071811 [Phakopsora pachyrhizi]|uniref:DUF2433 domain-containing protein n=1 Tax=Phakopsora pachyrhizi TaxID=170000 RepID=A0AAV0B099_PHAPC|nr:hypothetical protein BY996DRAFT_1071811 [Phakopsora pachyrhizi]CAH7675514.1 hypothetical protein PPACK8108_LOCUS10532 [Phakopsora pachyrhizi]